MTARPKRRSATARCCGAAGASVADYSRVAFDLHLRHAAGAENESWSVVLDNLELSRAQQSWRSKSISLDRDAVDDRRR